MSVEGKQLEPKPVLLALVFICLAAQRPASLGTVPLDRLANEQLSPSWCTKYPKQELATLTLTQPQCTFTPPAAAMPRPVTHQHTSV